MPYDVNPILDRLLEAFPAVLDRKAPKPLKIGLGEELLALAGVHPALADLTRTQVRRALKVYTGAPAYRKALARGGLLQRAKAAQAAERERREAEARARAEAERRQREVEQGKIQEPERSPAEPPAPKQEPPKWAIPAPRPKPRYPAPGG